jgi:broad specificity phosphatase PhoE
MRLILIAPGPTTGTRSSVFGDTGSLLAAAGDLPVRPGRPVFRGPEPACAETTASRPAAVVIEELRGPDFGDWTGLGLEQLLMQDPAGLQKWIADPAARPHGGESLVHHLERVAALLDAYGWPEDGAAVVASSFTVRAACLHALAAGPDSLAHFDVPPAATATISRNAGTWRFQSLVPPGTPSGR